MNTVTIEKENLSLYEALIPKVIAEDIGRKYYRAFGIFNDDEVPVGACVYKLIHLENANHPTQARLDHLIVDPRERGKGYGKALMEEFNTGILSEGAKSSFFELPVKENEKTAEFLKKYGYALEEKEGDLVRVTIEDIMKSPLAAKARIPDIIGDIGEVPMRKVKKGIMNSVFSGNDIEEDLPNLPLFWFQSQLSAFTMKDEKVTGLFLIHQSDENIFEPMLLFALEPDAKKDLLNMVRFSAQKVMELCPPESYILINRRNNSIRKLVGGLFPWVKGEPVYRGKREEG